MTSGIELPTVVGMTTPSPLRTEEQRVVDYWRHRVAAREMTPGTAARYERVFASFVRFTAAHGLGSLSEVRPDICTRFVRATRRDGGQPAPSTSRFRLTVVRDAYNALAAVEPNIEDPTAALQIGQAPQQRAVVPLTPSEVIRLRAAGRVSPRDHLRPAAVELALAGGTHREIASAVVADITLEQGNWELDSRSLELDAFATSAMRARIASCRLSATRSRQPWTPQEVALALKRPLAAYAEASVAPGISSTLSRAMRAAGVTRPGVRAASIREFAANRVYAAHQRVEEVAALLGTSSLDAAMGYVDAEWQSLYGAEFRA